ncbi:MAG: ATP-grasp domain-containing protein [Planctomycetes bacterium]|nr:ATP-grasp domain-containing protein [Planctomycetota bacterium]
MVHVVFVAPYFGNTILKCIDVISSLEDVKLGVISQQPEEHLPPKLRERVSGHYRIPNTLDVGQLVVAARGFQREWGTVDRLLGFLEQLQLPLAEAREALGISGMHTEAARNFRDKNCMKAVLAQAGLPVARQARIRGLRDAEEFVERVGFPIILKPLDGLGTRDTFRVSDQAELYAALNKLLPTPARPAQAEEFVRGAEHTFETMSIRGEAVWSSSTYYLPGPLEVVESPWIQYCVLLPKERLGEHSAPFAEINAKALKALGMQTGLSHMEWFHTKSGKRVISEVAARPPGVNIMSVNSFAHEVDMWEKWARLMVHETFTIPERKWAAGAAFLRGSGAGRTVARIDGLKEVLHDLGDAVVQTQLPRVGMPRSSHYEGEGWVIVRHPETQGAAEALQQVISRTRIHYA